MNVLLRQVSVCYVIYDINIYHNNSRSVKYIGHCVIAKVCSQGNNNLGLTTGTVLYCTVIYFDVFTSSGCVNVAK